MHHGWTEVRCFGRVREVHTLARYSIGDYQDHFSIQSTSKPFTYALALNHMGAEVIYSVMFLGLANSHIYLGKKPYCPTKRSSI